MGTMNVSLPDELRAFVEERVQEGHYGTSSEYIRELIRKDQARHALRSTILEGLASPSVAEAGPDYWANKRKQVKRRS